MAKTNKVRKKSKPEDIINIAIKEGRSSLLEDEADRLAESYGIAVPKAGLARNEREAASIARKVGFPVAMKIVSPDILHKTDVGGVKLGIKSQAEVRRAYGAIIKSAKKAAGISGIRGVYVQKMAEKSHEFVVGGIRDSQFGPAVMFGIGGIYVELFKDVTFKLAPVSKEEALLMTREIKASPLMYGFRGAKPLDVDSAVEAIQAVGRMMTDNQQIASIDINPLLIYEKGAIAVDVRVVLRK